jgi:hypothetical protein
MTRIIALFRALGRWFSNDGQHPQGCDCNDCISWQEHRQ